MYTWTSWRLTVAQVVWHDSETSLDSMPDGLCCWTVYIFTHLVNGNNGTRGWFCGSRSPEWRDRVHERGVAGTTTAVLSLGRTVVVCAVTLTRCFYSDTSHQVHRNSLPMLSMLSSCDRGMHAPWWQAATAAETTAGEWKPQGKKRMKSTFVLTIVIIIITIIIL